MAKFFKATNRRHPKHELPSVLWNPAADKAVYEFLRGDSGYLEFETDDPDTIKILQDLGYDQEPEESMSAAPPAVKGPSTATIHRKAIVPPSMELK